MRQRNTYAAKTTYAIKTLAVVNFVFTGWNGV